MQKKGESKGVFDVITFGENSIDVLATVPHWPGPDEKLELLNLVTLPGGQAATAAVACARLGCRTQYLGVFGDDEHGRLVERAIEAEGVDTTACLQAEAPNRAAYIVIDPSAGTRAVLWRRDSALKWPDPFPFADVVAQSRSLLVDTTDLDAAVAAASAARAASIPVIVDVDTSIPGVDRLLAQVDVIVAAEGFAQAHTGASSLGSAMRKLRGEYPASLVVVTLGAAGAVAWDGMQELRSPGFVVDVLDPTGAGDAFRAGFLTAWLDTDRTESESLSDVLDFANATAALNCRAVGAQRGLPSRPEVLGLLTDSAVRRSNQSGRPTGDGPS
jgi:sulfofructose kinase